MLRFIPVVILSAMLLAGCGAGGFGTQMGVFPRSNIPILGGGAKKVGDKIVHTKSGDTIKGLTYYDSTTDSYIVYSDVSNSWLNNTNSTTIPADQVVYMESRAGE